MKQLLLLLIVAVLFLTVGCGGEKKDAKISEPTGNAMIIAEGPLTLTEGSNTEASGHNEEGISHYKEGHYDVALKHFRQLLRLILVWGKFITTKPFHSISWENTVKPLNISKLLKKRQMEIKQS